MWGELLPFLTEKKKTHPKLGLAMRPHEQLYPAHPVAQPLTGRIGAGLCCYPPCFFSPFSYAVHCGSTHKHKAYDWRFTLIRKDSAKDPSRGLLLYTLLIISMEKALCPACGPAQANHTVLWINNSSDVLSVFLSGTKNAPVLQFFANLGEGIIWILSRILFIVGQKVGIVELKDDITQARSDRSKLLWEEAQRRDIGMRQLFLCSSSTDVFEVRIDSKRYFLQSIPVPPHKEARDLDVDDKVVCKRILSAVGLPVPKSYSVQTFDTAKKILQELGVVCVKPQTGSNGRHTYPYVKTEEQLTEALQSAKEICFLASVEEHLEGNLCRATCIDGVLVGFLESLPPSVTGDGSLTVTELIARANKEKPSGVAEIVITPSHEGYIGRRGYRLTDIVPQGVSLPLTYRAGWGQGGSNREHGRAIHPSFIPLLELAARVSKLPVVGFDLIIPNPLEDAGSQRWGFVEANSLPWIDIHNVPLHGTPIDVSPYVWDLWK